VALCPVRNDGVSVCASDTVWKELFELVAVFLGTAVDGGRRRHRDEAVAVIGSVSIAERGSDRRFGGDVLLIAVLPVEVENVFDGPEVAGFVWGSGCIFDVVERELVFSGSCDSCAGVGAGALEALVTVAMCVFLTTERLDAGGVEALDQRFEKDCFEVLVSDGLGKRGER